MVAYDEGVFVGYRGWLRSGKTPLYAFGHGLGYTSWHYEEMAVNATEAVVTLTNAGARSGREIVQVYVSSGAPSPLPRPARWLAGFANVEAHPGETVTVRIPLPPRTFQVWNKGWQTIPGAYTVAAAHALDDLRLKATLTIS